MSASRTDNVLIDPACPDGYLLRSESELLDIAQAAVDYAKTIGATAASALASENAGTTIKVRDGAPISSVRDGGQSVTITVYDDGRVGTASTEALDRAAISLAVEKAAAIARQVERDVDAGLPDPRYLALDSAEVETFAPSGLSPGALTEIALAIETSAIDHAEPTGPALRINESAASSADFRWARATSDRFARAASASMQSRACVVIAEDGNAMARDWWHVTDRREDRLPAAQDISREAVERAWRKLGGRALSTRSAPVLLDARIAVSLIGDLTSGLSGMAQHQRSTFLAGALGSQRLAAHLDLDEDPFESWGLATAAWDSDGIAAAKRKIVNAGTIEGYFLNARMARKLGMSPTGNADGPTNITLVSRDTVPGDDLAAMLRRMGTGLWVTHFMGGGVNGATGAYSKAVEGYWVENGAIVHPVQDMTVAGDLPSMLRNIVAVGADQYRQGGMRSGPILLDSMRLAGR